MQDQIEKVVLKFTEKKGDMVVDTNPFPRMDVNMISARLADFKMTEVKETTKEESTKPKQ